MKNNLITAAIIAASSFGTLAIADASNTVYGDFRATLSSLDGTPVGTSDGLTISNNASRVGIKGSTSMDGTTAFYHVQMGANNDGGGAALSSRFYFAGLKGGFGKVVYGRTSTAYKMAGVRLDPFYDTVAGGGDSAQNFGLSNLSKGFTDNSLAYTSNKIGGGITVNVAAYFDDSAADEHDTNIGVTYKNKDLTAGVQIISMGDTGVISQGTAGGGATRLHGTYKMGANTVSLSHETVDVNAADDETYIYLTASHQMNAKTKVSAAFGSTDDVADPADGLTVGVFHNIMPKTSVYALYSNVDHDSGNDRTSIAVGVSHKFGMKH